MKVLFILLILSFFNFQNQDCVPYFEYDDTKFCKGQVKILDLKQLSCRLPDNSNSVIMDSLYFFLQEHQELDIEIAAYSICRGSEKYNLLFTDRKANSIKQFLIKKGIKENRLSAKGYGRLLFKDCQDCNECKNEKIEVTNGLIKVIIL